MRQQTQTQYAVCPACRITVGEGMTLAELAKHTTCPQCSGPTVVRAYKPTAKPKRHHGGMTRRKYLDPETLLEFRKWMALRAKQRKSYRAHTDHLLVEILARTGLRAGEIVSTAWHPDRYLRIGDLVLIGGDPAIEVKAGKGNVSRVVRIASSLAALVTWYRDTYRDGAGPDEPLIVSIRNPKLAARYRTLDCKCKMWSREYAEYVARNGGRPLGLILRAHVFRHSFSVDFLQKNNYDYRALAEVLGHADPSVTMSTYCHTSEGKARVYADNMQ